jgi:CHAT domain-containing protein
LKSYWAGDYPAKAGYGLYTNIDYLAQDDQNWFLQIVVLQDALQIIREDPDVVLRGLEQERLSEALLMSGNSPAAEASFMETRRLFAESPEGSRKQNLEAEAEIGLANIELRRGEARAAVARLEKIQATINSIPDKDLSLIFFQTLGLAYLKTDEEGKAEQNLVRSLSLSEEGLGLISSERKRLEWSRKNEVTYRALVEIKFPKNPEQALAYWEWYKGASLRSGGAVRPTSVLKTVPRLRAEQFLSRDDVALVSYELFDRGTAVWVYDSNGVRGRWLELTKAEAEALARRFAQHCADPNSDPNTLRSEGLELYEKIFQPIEDLLPNDRQLAIEPDGALGLVPFEALTDKLGVYLGDRYALTFSSGLYYLAAARPWLGISAKSPALIVGDPAAPGWSPLRSATTEAQDVAALFENPRLLIRDAVQYPAIVEELPRVQVFHFSGHATASTVEAGLVIGGSSLLNVFKLERISLKHNRLVVLSACASARGTTGIFSDPSSTARLLVGAGVPEVIASRWAVDSAATAFLMKEFYAQLLSGASVSDSLHGAEVKLRRESRMSHPYYWASFAAFGRG